MTQADNWQVGSNPSGLLMRQAVNKNVEALATLHKGSTPPDYAEDAGFQWLDDSDDPVWTLRVFKGGTVSDLANWGAVWSYNRATGDYTLSGNVGIGVNAVGSRLDVQASAADASIQRWKSHTGAIIGQVYETSGGYGLLDIYNASGTLKARIDAGGGISVQDGLFYRCYNPTNTKYGELKTDSEGVILIAQSSGDTLKLATIDQSVQIWHGGNLRWWVTNPGTMLNPGTYGNTTASAANVYVHTDGSFNRSTSSLRFKEVLEPISDDWAYKLLDLDGIFYKSKCSGDNPAWTYYGFGAEDVAGVDPRWVFWKTHEYSAVSDMGQEPVLAELPEPVADGVQYERMVVALQHIAKREKARADAAEARMDALEARIAALEAA